MTAVVRWTKSNPLLCTVRCQSPLIFTLLDFQSPLILLLSQLLLVSGFDSVPLVFLNRISGVSIRMY